MMIARPHHATGRGSASGTAPPRRDADFQLVARGKEEWEAAVDAVSDLVFLIGPEGRILRCNRSASEALGRTFREILGRRLENLLRTAGFAGFRPGEQAGELRLVPGGRVLEYTRFPASSCGRNLGHVFVFRDVTELRHLRIVAARVDMMNNLGHVLSSVRHEIGNPTNAMKTALTVMKESLHEFTEEKLLSYIHRCLDDVRRIQALLEQLRTLNVFDVSCQQRIDLRAFLAAKVPAIREGLEEQDIGLDLSVPDDGAFEATCDPLALYQIVLGLITNASEAIGDRPRPRLVRVALGTWSEFVGVTVSDTGSGIEPELLGKVILPLFTTKPGGTGLGLAIAHEMVSRMGGSLEIGNDPELGGARVTVHLRASAARPEPSLHRR